MIQPQFIDVQLWADSLRIDYPDDNIPQLQSEQDWKAWGDELVQCQSFILNNAPGTVAYDKWEEWANAVYFVMQNADQPNPVE